MPDDFSRGRADQNFPQSMIAASLYRLGGPESVVIEEIPASDGPGRSRPGPGCRSWSLAF
jgi:hypothetical protein